MSKVKQKPWKVSNASSLSNRRKDASTKDMDAETKTFCRTHLTKQLLLYCSFCEKPVCDLCKTSTHARHLTEIKGHVALMNAAKLRRKYLHKLADYKDESIIPTIKNLILQIMECKGRLQSQLTKAVTRYQNYANIHRDKLSITQDEWIEDVMYRAKAFYQIMNEKMEVLKTDIVETQAVLVTVRNELTENSNPELLLNFTALRSGLESLHSPKWPREEVTVTMKVEAVPEFGSELFHRNNFHEIHEKNCTLEMIPEILEPIVYKRVFDTKLPLHRRVFDDEHNKISLSSAKEMYVSYGEYIVVYPLDNRRTQKASTNIRFLFIMNVQESVIDISSDINGTLFFLTATAVKVVTKSRKIRRCFNLNERPSALCIVSTPNNERELLVAFHDAGTVVRYTADGTILCELTHPDPRMVYRPRHIDVNCMGDIFLSDDISNVTILDADGIWKGAINRDVKTTLACGPLRPSGIACTKQRHVFIIDSSAVTQLHIFSEDGRYLQTAVFKNLQDAYVVHVDRTGDVWVAFKDGRIRIYRPQFLSKDNGL